MTTTTAPVLRSRAPWFVFRPLAFPLALWLAAGCAASDDSGVLASGSPGPAYAPGAASVPESAASNTIGTFEVASASTPQAGTLTAGAWDDNRNYARFTSFRAETSAGYGASSGLLPFADADFDAAHDSAEDGVHRTLDIALMIDTTGSMGDEIAYLQAEFASISRAIAQAYPNAAQRWALVLYRDQGDEYVTRKFDFSDDLSEFRERLADQSAGGGGDTPEAPPAGFARLTELSWRDDADTARLAFWLADAPHHADDAQTFAAAVRATQDLGVHVYPVASSGLDAFTELTMRTIAQLTHGRYLFLTNDSGVGGDHLEPSIPCYFVTLLDHAILRMVEIELSGEYAEPEPSEILRAAGDPQDGACTLASGQSVAVF